MHKWLLQNEQGSSGRRLHGSCTMQPGWQLPSPGWLSMNSATQVQAQAMSDQLPAAWCGGSAGLEG